MMYQASIAIAALTILAGSAVNGQFHPLDSITGDEITSVVSILRAENRLTDTSRFGYITLDEPDKDVVKSFKAGDPVVRRALAYIQDGTEVFKAMIDITASSVISFEPQAKEGMILLEEFLGATDKALSSPDMVAGLAARGFGPQDVYCLPLTAGYFGTGAEAGRRLMKVPCYKLPTESNWFAHPIEGLFATVDLKNNEVIEVVDTGIIPVNDDPWGYKAHEVEKRLGSLRGSPPRNGTLTQSLLAQDKHSFTIDGSFVNWDIWRFHYRVDKRPGLILSQIEVNDMGSWRSVLYQAFVSEVFVPYMDPDAGWYFRTYMDSGEYGFGIFMSPLRPGLDCPKSATFKDVTMHDDLGNPFAIPGAMCIFERSIGDPLWRHFELFEQSETVFEPAQGRPATELVIRYASQVGNYDYLIDYIFQQDGVIRMAVGATGIDAVKGAISKSMKDPTAAKETLHGNLVAPNLVAPFHSHFFNFRLDFDIDGEPNNFVKGKLVEEIVNVEGVPRTSIWNVQHERPMTEIAARTQINPSAPSAYFFQNANVEGSLGHNPAYELVPDGSFSYSLLSPDDWPTKRNAYIENQLWVSAYDKTQMYSGGEYAFQSDGSDTLKTWTDADRSIDNTDLVAWYTVGFHHVTRKEDWPVMNMKWTSFKLKPMNFFDHNPAINIADTIDDGPLIEGPTGNPSITPSVVGVSSALMLAIVLCFWSIG